MATLRYGTLNTDYVATWFARTDDGPMWALNLMKYREVADYRDDQRAVESPISGMAADDRYRPVGPLAAVGARALTLGVVEHQLVGDSVRWDRVALVRYPRRLAMVEMQQRDDFRKLHVHKEAGMEQTIVMATFPRPSETRPPSGLSAVEGTDRRLLVQVVPDGDAPDLAVGLDAVRLGCFDVEGVIVGDGRSFGEVRWDVLSSEAAAVLATRSPVESPHSYALVLVPEFDHIASSLADVP